MRFTKIPGLDYKQGAKDYARKLPPSDRHHLLTKPFYNLAHKHDRWQGEGPDADTHRHFCDFANMAVALALPPGARILDVGCGSGWLCEYFARFGYDVTGIDISDDLIQLAHQRLNAIAFGADQEHGLKFRFAVHDIEASSLLETFDAIICYDSLHHFEDEHAVLRHLYSMLNLGGQLFILEGERPPEGSPTEDELRAVMEEYQTLESPFARDYLQRILRDTGFAIVGDYVSINGLFDREFFAADRTEIQPEPFNYLLCKKVASPAIALRDSRTPGKLEARLTLNGEPPATVGPGELIELELTIENTGDTVWLVSRSAPKGTVRLGTRILDERGRIVAEVHGAPPLPGAVVPGASATVLLKQKAPVEPGSYIFKVDLICQQICWFEQQGSQPLAFRFRVTT